MHISLPMIRFMISPELSDFVPGTVRLTE